MKILFKIVILKIIRKASLYYKSRILSWEPSTIFSTIEICAVKLLTWIILTLVLLLKSFTFLNAIAIIFSNIFNIHILRQLQELQLFNRILLINLSAAGLVNGFVFLPGFVDSVVNEWLLGNIYCRISIILNGSSFTVIIWCLDAINAYRYITIHRPIFRRDSIKYSTELVTNAFFWILGIIIFTIPLYQKKEFFRFPSNIHLCCLLKYSDIFSIVYTLLMYILNAIVLGVPIFKIYRILKILNKINVT